MKFVILLSLALLSASVSYAEEDNSWSEYVKAVEHYAAEQRSESEQSIGAKAAFSCSIPPRSNPKPNSVHKLQPGDIDVIAAIGDSLTAANGAKASLITGLLEECRGVAWNMGGEKDVSTISTLPNILRKFNPNLYGFSLGSGNSDSANAVLNVGYPGHTSHEMLDQAKKLVARMRADPKVDFDNDWKLITFFIGGNDLCKYCKDRNKYTADNYISNLRATLYYFKDNLRRTFVNLVTSLDVRGINDLTGVTCRNMQKTLCDCGLSEANNDELGVLTKNIQTRTVSLVESGIYDDRDDFTVVIQPFMTNMTPPRKPNGTPDYSLFAPDCFHFSTTGHSAAGVELWNNMITPVGQKSDVWESIGQVIKCPSTAVPYLTTYKNKGLRSLLP